MGNLQLSGLPDGVAVKNSGSGTVSANGENVPAGETVTVESGLPFKIVTQPKDSIVTEGNTATFTIGWSSWRASKLRRSATSGASLRTAARRST